MHTDTTNNNQIIFTKNDGVPIKGTSFPRLKIFWERVLVWSILHLIGFYGFHVLITGQAKWKTVVLFFIIEMSTGLGITVSAHRYWSHKTFKATEPLKVFLVFIQTMAFQTSIRHWVRDHRLHHKYSDTDADPHNASRGFFYSHFGWLLCEKSELVKEKGKLIDLTDLDSEWLVRFQDKYYYPLGITLAFVIPTIIPWTFWGEQISVSLPIVIFNYVFTVHRASLVNSAAHLWGNKPYDISIEPSDNWFVDLTSGGEGWHNFHHVFPWNYKTEEFGCFRYSRTTALIELFAALGLAYDLKTVKKELIDARALRTGDGSRVEPSL